MKNSLKLKSIGVLAIVLSLLISLVSVSVMAESEDSTKSQTKDKKKPRTVLLLDPELDDQNSLVRYLLYSNNFDTKGIVYQSSSVHWKGDGKGTLFQGASEHSRMGIGPIASWRWDEGTRFIEEAIDIYSEVYPNLSVHAKGFPLPNELGSRIYEGNVEFPGDISKDSQGSELIKSLLLDKEPGPLYLLTGAGHSTVGRALKSIEEEYKNTAKWNQIYQKVSKKAIIQSWGDQDGVYANYIGQNWPDIEFRNMRTTIWGYSARRAVLPEDRHYLSAAWTRENVTKVGPFGEFYMVWGDGKQMHKNDITDFFGFAGLNRDQLRELGYNVWTDPQEAGSWISEGDTPIFMNLIDNGLEAHEDFSYGGWGGRDGEDINPNGVASKDYSSARWFGAAQRDFATRMHWTVTPEYSDANHAPVIEVMDTKHTNVSPGKTVTLEATVKDPDGDHLTGRWWRYEEADTYGGKIELVNLQEKEIPQPVYTYPFNVPAPGSPEIEKVIQDEIEVSYQFTVPSNAKDGDTLHFIFEATDNGNQSLTSYQRVVYTVKK